MKVRSGWSIGLHLALPYAQFCHLLRTLQGHGQYTYYFCSLDGKPNSTSSLEACLPCNYLSRYRSSFKLSTAWSFPHLHSILLRTVWCNLEYWLMPICNRFLLIGSQVGRLIPVRMAVLRWCSTTKVVFGWDGGWSNRSLTAPTWPSENV